MIEIANINAFCFILTYVERLTQLVENKMHCYTYCNQYIILNMFIFFFQNQTNFYDL